MKHQYRTPEECTCDKEFCLVCVGGLSICKVCRLYEGSLTTECPGYDCYGDKAKDIYAGKIDFKDGKWVEGSSCHCPEYWRRQQNNAGRINDDQV